MKITAGAGLATLCLLLVVGCATAPPPPKSSSDTLLAGQLVFTLSGFKTYGSVSVNGRQATGVDITLRNVYTHATIKTETHGPNGMFFVYGATPGEYQFVRIYFRRSLSGSWSYAYLRPRSIVEFRIAPGGVSNVGFVDVKLDNSGYDSIVSGKGFAQVKNEFAKMFPNSPWDSASWRQASVFPANGM